MAEFVMPSLGADMESGVLLEWLVRPGDHIRKGDIIAVVDTAKAAVDVECFVTGVVDRLLVEPGAKVAVGTPLATITTDAAEPRGPPRPRPRPHRSHRPRWPSRPRRLSRPPMGRCPRRRR
jgi:pyruvate dehydrogenase E2 component (dihydrolipoamide acetyltransferase)